MDTRLGWLAALGAFGLVTARMGSLLTEGFGTVSWFPILFTAAVLGGAVTALLGAASVRPPAVLAVTMLGAGLALARVAAGPTLVLGFIPGGESVDLLAAEVAIALELIRYGAAPVLAVPGLVAVLAALYWLLGAVIAFGGMRRRPGLMILPPLGFYLILATLDRAPVRWWFVGAMALVGGLGLLAGRGRRAAGRARYALTGRAVPATARTLPMAVLFTLMMAAVWSTGAFAAVVPESGMVSWRSASGFGGGLFGGFSINLFAGMRQDLVGNDATVVFVARVSEAAPPNQELYWKLTTLDVFDGEYWRPARFAINRPTTRNWEAEDFAFRGPTIRVEQVVQIVALRQNYLPLIYSPVAMRSDDPLLSASHRVREDGSVTFDTNTREGMQYRVTSDIPQADLSVLASNGAGQLSPLFAQAVEAGEIVITPAPVQIPLPPGRVRDDYLDLPDDLPEQLSGLARTVAGAGTTDYERALLLESFFLTDPSFVYDAAASTGHSSINLTEWLSDPDSRNYRRGYCEQFATAMAVMARSLGIPSRVVMGFAPGEVQNVNGEEQIVVRARNAHAWVELYLAGQGWIRFDPTPRGDSINRGTVEDLGFDPTLYLPEPGAGSSGPGAVRVPPDRVPEFEIPGDLPPGDILIELPSRSPMWIPVLAAALVATGLVPGMKEARRLRRRHQVKAGDLFPAWRQVSDLSIDLGYRVVPSQTPRELAVAVDRSLLPLAGAVSAYLYGGKIREDRLELMKEAERRLRQKHRGRQWWSAQLSLRSLPSPWQLWRGVTTRRRDAPH